MTKGLHKNSLRKVDNPHQWMIDDARMELIQQIKAEMERRIKSWQTRGEHSPEGQGKDTCVSRVTELTDLLSFLSDLEKSEKPSDGLEEEITIISKNEYFDFSDWKAIARHFAKWGAEHRGSSEIPNDLEAAAWKLYPYEEGYDVDLPYPSTYDENEEQRKAFITGAKWQKAQSDKELSEKIASAYQLGLADKEKQTVNEAEKPCHTVEEWMEHIKNADQLTKDIFSKGPYNVLYDALNHPYRDCYDAIKEFGELCYQTAREDMMKEAVEGEIINAGYPTKIELNTFYSKFEHGQEVVKLIIIKED